jgi:multiple sugar transport system permease protein
MSPDPANLVGEQANSVSTPGARRVVSAASEFGRGGQMPAANELKPIRRNLLAQARHEFRRSNKWGYVFIAPLIIDFLIFFVYLIIRAITMSFQDVSFGTATWVGFDNFARMLREPQFFNALKNTTIYTVGVVPGGILIALIFSEMIFRRSARVQAFYKSAYYLPGVVSTVAMSLVWLFIYQPFGGILNYVTSLFGMDANNWMGNPLTAMPSLIVMGIVGTMGASVVFLTAAMGGISPELYDAAKIDGASEWQRLWRVTVPLLRPTLLYLFVVGFIANFQVFEQVYVMTSGGPGFPGATTTVGYLIYSSAFLSLNIGYAAAESMALFVVILLVSIFQFRFFANELEY